MEFTQTLNIHLLLAALKACSHTKELELGRLIHTDSVRAGCISDTYTRNALVNMYGKCGSLTEAHTVFSNMHHQSVVSFTAMMLVYVEHNKEEDALDLFSRMSCSPNPRTFSVALRACTGLALKEQGRLVNGQPIKVNSLQKGMNVHCQAAKSSQFDIFVASAAVEMYAKCGSMIGARATFDMMPQHDVVSLVSLILGYVANGEAQEALSLSACFRQDSACVFAAAVKACACLASEEQPCNTLGVKVKSLEKGMKIHSEVEQLHRLEVQGINSLVDMYAECGSMYDARMVFDRMEHHTLVSWNSLIMGYVEDGEDALAIELFACMKECFIQPDARTFVGALMACGSLLANSHGEFIDGRLVKAGKIIEVQPDTVMDLFVGNTLVDMYAKCGRMVEAQRTFELMPCHNTVSRTALMLGYVENGNEKLAMGLFFRYFEDAGTDPLDFVVALKACSKLAEKEDFNGDIVKLDSLEKCMEIHHLAAERGLDTDLLIETGLIEVYAKCGSIFDSRRIFDKMAFRTVVTWTALLQGYVENGEAHYALDLFSCMRCREKLTANALTLVVVLQACSALAEKEEATKVDNHYVKLDSLRRGMDIHSQSLETGCDLDVFVVSGLLKMYWKCGASVDARRVFDRSAVHNAVLWNNLILCYAEKDEEELALQLFSCMRAEGYATDVWAYTAALKAAGGKAAPERIRGIHAEVCTSGAEKDEVLATCLVDTYAKCGSLVEARCVFDGLVLTKFSVVAWNAMIGGYSCQGYANQVFELFWEMQDGGAYPDEITFICLLTVCSRAGLTDKGKEFFNCMRSMFGVRPGVEHKLCMIDMLGRANRLEEAVTIAESVGLMGKDKVAWTMVLSGCKKWGNLELAKVAFDKLVEIGAEDSAGFTMMANIYQDPGTSL